MNNSDWLALDVARTRDFLRITLDEAWLVFKRDQRLFITAGVILLIASMLSAGLLAAPLSLGFIYLLRRRLNGRSAEASDIFEGFYAFGASAFTFLCIAGGILLGSVFLLIPGLIFGVLSLYALHFLAYEDLAPTQALAASKALVRENAAKVGALVVVLAAMNLLMGMTVIGLAFTLPFAHIAIQISFEYLTHRVATPAPRALPSPKATPTAKSRVESAPLLPATPLIITA